MHRRDFLLRSGALSVSLAAGCRNASHLKHRSVLRPSLLFTSAGKTCWVDPLDAQVRPLEFHHPNQATWQPGPMFQDGRRMLVLSMEPRRDGPGRPFDEYYTQTPTHLWAYDWSTGTLAELATQDRMAVFYTPQLLINDRRLLVQVVKGRVGQVYSMNLDGTEALPFTKAGEGLPYGFSLSPDGGRVAYHIAGPQGYQIWTCTSEGGDRRLIRAHPDALYFAPMWSPDGRWLAYQDCRFRQDPGHDWSDLWISRPDGSEHRRLTERQSLWFAASYGNPGNKGSGSNVPSWTRLGTLLASQRLPDSKVPWEFQAGRPDTDHFNRDWKPAEARGGTFLSEIDPLSGKSTALTKQGDAVWDFRGVESPDGQWVAFCRCGQGDPPSLWVLDRATGTARKLTQGLEDRGVDHPRWITLRLPPVFPS
ncbi:MAG: serine/threonine protein kinase [Verrucomicrobia bacterium]|nr:serine/threonine protein kinase [Verrucomicrobiota bacterium]